MGMERTKLTPRGIAKKVATIIKSSVKKETVERWIGGRKPGENKFAALVTTLKFSSEEEQKLREAYSQLAVRQLAVAERPLDREEKVVIDYVPDFYEPFSGTPKEFVDDLIVRAFELADIYVRPASGFEQPGGYRLDMPRRLEAIELRKAHLLVNLVTLSRLRKLTFFETPIRVSLNVVAPDRPNDDVWPMQLEEARRILGGLAPENKNIRNIPFEILTIEGEVGYKYVQRLKRRVPWLRLTAPVGTLAPEALKKALETANTRTTRTILVCDEITALRVRDCFKDGARLLYPLTTESSVQGSRTRRAFPHHVLGIGYRLPGGDASGRDRDEDDERLFNAVLTNFVGLEVETTAVKYEDLYKKLYKLVRSNLATSPELYVGGMRKILVEDPRTWYHRALIDQTARSYAFRCLQLSQRAADGYRESNPWTPMLRRARQRVIQLESRRRNAIRGSLRSAIGVAAGRSESSNELTRDDFRRALCAHGLQLAYILERDFEVRFPGGPALFCAHARDSFERFLSFIQEQLEIASGDTNVIVTSVTSKAELRNDDVALRYDEFLQSANATSQDKARYENRKGRAARDATIIKATSLGETVGLMWMRRNGAEVELFDLFVAENMRGSRTSQLFIRHAIDAATNEVRIPLGLVPERRKNWFRNVGFIAQPAAGPPTYLSYQCFQLKDTARPDRAPTATGKQRARRQR